MNWFKKKEVQKISTDKEISKDLIINRETDKDNLDLNMKNSKIIIIKNQIIEMMMKIMKMKRKTLEKHNMSFTNK